MSTTIIERPPHYSFSKNDIRYVLQSTDISAAGFFVRLKLSYRKIGGDLIELKTFTRLPNDDGKTYVYINGILDSLLSYQMPDPAKLLTDASAHLVHFYVEFGEGNAEDLDPDLDTDLDPEMHVHPPTRMAIKGGIERQKFCRNNYWENYFDVEKPFFTWQPDNKWVQMNESVFMSLFIPFDDAPGQLFHDFTYKKIKITVWDIENNEYSREVTVFEIHSKWLYHINVSPVFLALSDLAEGNTIWKYSVVVQNTGDDTYFINPRTFYIDYRPVYTPYDLLWVNSLGGVDMVRVRGEVIKGFSKEIARVSPGLDVNDSETKTKVADVANSTVIRSDSYKGDIGWVEDEIAQDAMIDLDMSKAIYQYLDGRWVPLMQVQSGLDLRAGSDKKFSFPIEWRLAINNEVYTPSSVDLGFAEDSETYP